MATPGGDQHCVGSYCMEPFIAICDAVSLFEAITEFAWRSKNLPGLLYTGIWTMYRLFHYQIVKNKR